MQDGFGHVSLQLSAISHVPPRSVPQGTVAGGVGVGGVGVGVGVGVGGGGVGTGGVGAGGGGAGGGPGGGAQDAIKAFDPSFGAVDVTLSW